MRRIRACKVPASLSSVIIQLVERKTEHLLGELQKAAASEATLAEPERKEILKQLREFRKRVEEIEKAYKAGDLESWIEPQGAEGRTWKQELQYARRNRKERYVPQLTYPALERGYLDPSKPEETKLDTKGGLEALRALQDELPETFRAIPQIATQTIEKKRKEFLFLQAVKDKEHKEAVRNMPHSAPSLELVQYAQEVYQKRLEPQREKTPVGEKLAKVRFHAYDFQEYFEYALELIGATNWKTEVTRRVSRVTVSPEKRTVYIPYKNKLSGIRLLALIAHEIGVHVATGVNAERNGFGSTYLGTEGTVLNEGLAKLAEKDVEEMLQGFANPPRPYYVLTIQKALETGGDFWSAHDYLVELRRKELEAQRKYEEEKTGNEGKYTNKYVSDETYKTVRKILKRIFRGAVDLSRGGYVYTKDKAYLEGEVMAQKIKEQGLLGYMLAGKFDLPTAIYLLKIGGIPKSAAYLTVEVAQKIWNKPEDRDFIENLRWYRANYNPPYWREFGLTDEEYAKRWIELGKST